MPTYQYQCSSCGHAFEQYQSITTSALTVCPKCEEASLQKVISGGAGYFLRDSGVMPEAKPSSSDPEKKTKKKHSCGHDHSDGSVCNHHHH